MQALRRERTEPQIIINEKGVLANQTKFSGWADIANEEAIVEEQVNPQNVI